MRERCPSCKRPMQRTAAQNARYWALLGVIERGVLLGGRQFAADPTWHVHFRKEYLGCEDVILPTGEVLTYPRSTTDLDVAEFNDYMTKVEAWAATEHGLYLDEMAGAA